MTRAQETRAKATFLLLELSFNAADLPLSTNDESEGTGRPCWFAG